jgi:hypothetical protein
LLSKHDLDVGMRRKTLAGRIIIRPSDNACPAITLAESPVDRVHLLSQMKILLALSFCLLASCAGLHSNSPSGLVGEWRYADSIQGCHYVFNRDGSFKGEVVYRGKLISKFTGRWSVAGGALLYTYVSDALHRIPAGATDRDKLLEVNRESFIIEAADGSKRKYLRVHSRTRST